MNPCEGHAGAGAGLDGGGRLLKQKGSGGQGSEGWQGALLGEHFLTPACMLPDVVTAERSQRATGGAVGFGCPAERNAHKAIIAQEASTVPGLPNYSQTQCPALVC